MILAWTVADALWSGRSLPKWSPLSLSLKITFQFRLSQHLHANVLMILQEIGVKRWVSVSSIVSVLHHLLNASGSADLRLFFVLFSSHVLSPFSELHIAYSAAQCTTLFGCEVLFSRFNNTEISSEASLLNHLFIEFFEINIFWTPFCLHEASN